MRTKSLLLVIIILVAYATQTMAQFWEQTNGGLEAKVYTIAITKNGNIFSQSDALHRSTDGGMTWKQIFTEAAIGSLGRIISLASGRIILVRKDSGLWKSDDDGGTWQKLPIGTMALWNAVNNELYTIDSGKAIFSTDEGDSWSILGLDGISGKPYYITADTSGRLFAISYNLYRSTDRGISWGKITNGVAGLSSIMPGYNDVMYSYVTDSEEGIVYRSDDGGRTWTQINEKVMVAVGSNRSISSIGINKYNQVFITLSSKFRYSVDNGSSWFDCVVPKASIQPVCFTHDQEGAFLVRSDRGFVRVDLTTNVQEEFFVPACTIKNIFTHPSGNTISVNSNGVFSYSTDEGDTWNTCTAERKTLVSTAIDANRNMYFCGTAGYIGKSTDSGINWTSFPSPTTTTITGITSFNSSQVFISTESEGIYRTTDNGKTWDQLNSGISDKKLYSILMLPNGDLLAGGIKKVYRSTNKGLTWINLNSDLPINAGAIRSIVISNSGGLMATIDSIGIYVSNDNALSWTLRAQGLNTSKVNSYTATPNGLLFAATEDGVFMLDTVPNSNWVQINDGLTPKSVLSICHLSNGKLLAGTLGSGIFRSLNSFDKQLTSASDLLPSSQKIAVSPTYPNPFTTSTTINYTLPKRDMVTITVFDILGRKTQTLANEVMEAGPHRVVFNGEDLPLGMYTVRITSGTSSEEMKVVLNK
jgi:photosystem II stability/assembly factor-like uncharacterized protein